jgi:hypothetical protein
VVSITDAHAKKVVFAIRSLWRTVHGLPDWVGHVKLLDMDELRENKLWTKQMLVERKLNARRLLYLADH